MKIRTDFVTNSSSSSFIVAKKPKLTDAENAAIAEWALKTFLGSIPTLTHDADEKEVLQFAGTVWYEPETVEEFGKVKQALEHGMDVFYRDDDLSTDVQSEELFSSFLDMLKENCSESYIEIDNDIHC